VLVRLVDWWILHRRDVAVGLFPAAVVFVGVGAVVGGLAFRHSQQPIGGGVLTTGHIVEEVVEESSDSDGRTRTVVFPIIEFTDRREHTHRFRGQLSGVGTVGDAVRVRYDPDDPSHAQWVDQPGGWAWILMVLIGLALLAAPAGLLIRRRRRGR